MRKRYPSDLSDKKWKEIKHLFDNENRGKHLRTQSKRKLVNGVLYVNKTGCQWRQLPNDFPCWKTVYSFFDRAKANGLWEQLNDLIVKKNE